MFFWVLTVFSLFFAARSAFADEIRLRAGFWPGERTSALEKHYFIDDLLTRGRLDFPWGNTSTMTVPVGLELRKSIGGNNLVILAEYARYMPEYKFMGLGFGWGFGWGGFSTVNLKGYTSDDLEVSAGIEFKQDKITITPRVGVHSNMQSFTYDELTFGRSTYTVTLDGPFDASAQGIFMGAGLKMELAPQISGFVDFAFTSPVLGTVMGDMSYTRIQAGISGGGTIYTYSSGKSDYEIGVNRFAVGIEYEMNKNMSVFGGIRKDTIKESYPNMFTMSYVIGSNFAAINISQIIFNQITYSMSHSTEKGLLYGGISLAIGK